MRDGEQFLRKRRRYRRIRSHLRRVRTRLGPTRKGWKRIRVRSYVIRLRKKRVKTHVGPSRHKVRRKIPKKVTRKVVRKRVTRKRVLRKAVPLPSKEWISRQAYFSYLENKFENFDWSRSDVPPSNLHWVKRSNRFFWIAKKYPPYGPNAEYALVSLYFVVWDRDDKIHKLFVNKLRTVKTASDANANKSYLDVIEKTLAKVANAQAEKMARSGFDTEGVDVKGLAAWTLEPEKEWFIKEQRRRAKRKAWFKAYKRPSRRGMIQVLRKIDGKLTPVWIKRPKGY